MARLDRQVMGWMKTVEKVLIRLVVLGLVTLVILQMTLARATDPVNFYLTMAQKIETPALSTTDVSWEPNLVLNLEGAKSSDLKILVNDQLVGDFGNGQLQLSLKVGDKLAIDARGLTSNQLKLKVTGVGADLTYPKLNQTWPLRKGILDLGEVK